MGEPQPSNAGIITDETGDRHIPESTRADGSTRKAIKIRPGYRPPEDVEVYKNRTAESFRSRGRAMGIPGAAGLKDDSDAKPEASSVANTKNAKKREAKKRAKVAAVDGEAGSSEKKVQGAATETKSEDVDPEVEREKKVRNLKKKLRQAKELKNKKDGGEALLPEQISKVIKINELIRELDALGFDAEGEPKTTCEEQGEEKDSSVKD
jgi:partner of Y14 and mago